MSLNIQKNDSVSLRNGFSDRYGLKAENKVLQTNNFDKNTRIILLNHLHYIYSTKLNSDEKQYFIKQALADIYKNIIDYDEFYRDDLLWNKINNTFCSGSYYDILSIIEYFYSNIFTPIFKSDYERYDNIINKIFEKEYVGYRMIKGQITPISNPTEIESIKEALYSQLDSISLHIDKALSLLKNNDYENTIKESITAVESMCCFLTNKNTTLGKTLSLLKSVGVHIHPCLEEAFDKLYGYASNENGIRHGGFMDNPKSTFDEAKFMLVSCCAFVNYLKGVGKERIATL